MNLYNFSGHPVDGYEHAPFVGVNFPSEGAGLAKMIREALQALPGREALLAGAAAYVILPGLSHAAAILLAEWHGQFGSFPRICWAVRHESGFVWSDGAAADLNEIRLTARESR